MIPSYGKKIPSYGKKIPMRLNVVRKKAEFIMANYSKNLSHDNFIDLIINKIGEIEINISDYLRKDSIDFSRNSINLIPFELKSNPSILNNLKFTKIPYKTASGGMIEIDYFRQINTTIRAINNSHINTIDDVRLYLNRLIRLKNQIVQAKYHMSFDFYNQSNGNQSGGNPSDFVKKISTKYSDMLEMVNHLIEEQQSITTDYKTFLNDLSHQQVAIPIRRATSNDCSALYSQTIIQYKKLEYIKNLLSRLLWLLDKKHKTVDDPEVSEAIRIVTTINLNEKPQPSPCNILEDVSQEVTYNFNLMKPHEEKIINYYEDIQASVRIYLRLNLLAPQKRYSVQKTGSNSVSHDRNEYGPFFSIYDQKTNEEMYYPSEDPEIKPIKGIFDQLKSGYSNFVFGYGYSGSGKTYTLFGKVGDTLGVLQLGLADLMSDPTINIKYKYLFEIYGRIFPTTTTTTYDSNIFVYHDKNRDMEKYEPFTKSSHELFNYEYDNMLGIRDDVPVMSTINQVISELTRIRVNNGHIKATVNNPESSRGHLFLTFEVIKTHPTTRTQTSSYITVVDMAGIENPQMIADMYFTEGTSNSQIISSLGEKTLQSKLKLKLRPKVMDPTTKKLVDLPPLSTIINILSEGLFINETINHLKYRLLERQEITLPIEYQSTYSVKKGEITEKTPIATDKYSPTRFFLNPAPAGRLNVLGLMLPILSFLESISTHNPSKFIMLALLRIDRELYTADTLNYAQSLIKVPSAGEVSAS